MLFTPGERLPMVGLPVLPVVAFQGHYPSPPHLYDVTEYHALFSMNAFSVGCLTVFLGLVFATRRR